MMNLDIIWIPLCLFSLPLLLTEPHICILKDKHPVLSVKFAHKMQCLLNTNIAAWARTQLLLESPNQLILDFPIFISFFELAEVAGASEISDPEDDNREKNEMDDLRSKMRGMGFAGRGGHARSARDGLRGGDDDERRGGGGRRGRHHNDRGKFASKKDDEQSQPSSPFLVSQEESLLLLADGPRMKPRSCQSMMVSIADGMGQQPKLLIAVGSRKLMIAVGSRRSGSGSKGQTSEVSASELLKHQDHEDQDLPLGMLVVVLRLQLCQRMMVQCQGQGLVMQKSQWSLSMSAHLQQCEERSYMLLVRAAVGLFVW
jgi:hypothetical protein